MEFSTNELIWAIINFVVFFVLLRLFLYRPVLKILDGRREEIRDNLAKAEQARTMAEKALAEHERQLAKARDEAQAVISRAQATAEKTKDEILSQAQRQAQDAIERAQRAIASEKERAVTELRREVADLAVMAAGKVLGRSLDVEDHREFVDEMVRKLPPAGGVPAGKTG
ncbi:MAG: ATP synthase F0 subunit B [Bacillota bacterium]|jgi:F-type H+-transporting ATPase subunit b|nr:MAG: ATP synthase F0 subunit B [Bacillota bacterium]